MKGPAFFLRLLLREGMIAVFTGLITFGVDVLLAPGTMGAAIAFALVAATAAAVMDTLYYHLLFRLRRAPAYTAEQRYLRNLEDTRHRLLDGSIRLREALIRRFQADYGRSRALTKVEGRTRRQVKEARRRLKARLWVVEQAISADQLLAATTEARSDPAALEIWSERTDGMVDVYLQVRQRLGFAGWFVQKFHPARLAAQVQLEWSSLIASAPEMLHPPVGNRLSGAAVE